MTCSGTKVAAHEYSLILIVSVLQNDRLGVSLWLFKMKMEDYHHSYGQCIVLDVSLGRTCFSPLLHMSFFFHPLLPFYRYRWKQGFRCMWNKLSPPIYPLIEVCLYPLTCHRSLSLLGLLAKIMCSICSFQLNIWNATHRVACILNWFLNLGYGIGACSILATGWPGIAVPPGSAHPSGG